MTKPAKPKARAPKGRNKPAQGNALGNAPPEDQSPEGATQLENGWRWVTLREIAQISGGVTKGQKRRPNEIVQKVPYLRVANVQRGYLDLSEVKEIEASESEVQALQLQVGDILFNEGGDRDKLGRGWIWNGELPVCVHQNHVFRARLRDSNDSPKFISFYGNSEGQRYFMAQGKQTTNLASINLTKLGQLPIPLPPPDDQRHIVAEIEKQFTRLEAGVAALRRVQANLKRYRAAVLKAACEGRLVPTEAELARAEGRPFESGQQLLARILTERRQIHEHAQSTATRKKKYKEPTAPSIPADEALPPGWTWATWDQIGVSQNGRPFPSAQYQETGFKLLRPGNLHVSGKIIWTDGNTRCMPQAFADENPDLIVGANELVMNLTAQSLKDEFLGRVCLTTEGEACLLNQRLARLRPIIVLPEFALYLLKAWRFRRFVDGLNSGSLIQHMFTSQVAEFTFPLPPLAEQTRIVAEVERRLSMAEELEAVVTTNLQRATRLRQSILQKAFTGELVSVEEPEAPKIQAPALTLLPAPAGHKPPNRHFARALLSAEIVHRLHGEPTFGRTKHQKIFHLCEHIARIGEIGGQYHREAAGPLDNKLIYANEAELKKQQWYAEVKRDSYGHAYHALPKAGTHRPYVERYWPEKLPMIEKLIELMRDWKTERCEIFCTAYAAWNDLLLQGQEPTDEAILHEILDCWNESKKRIPAERWLKAIHWMKQEGWEPQGFGNPTKRLK